MTGIARVLTVADLERQQLARETTVPGGGTRYEISPKGQAMLRANQAERAAWLQAHPDEARAGLLAAVAAARTGNAVGDV